LYFLGEKYIEFSCYRLDSEPKCFTPILAEVGKNNPKFGYYRTSACVT